MIPAPAKTRWREFGDRRCRVKLKKESTGMVNFSPYVLRIAMLLEELTESQIRAVYMVVSEFHDTLKKSSK